MISATGLDGNCAPGNVAAMQALATPDASDPLSTLPKAYLSVLFFDERFEFVGEGSVAARVEPGVMHGPVNSVLTLDGIKAPKNGYAFICLSNESAEPVYFDNLQVAHTRGRIVEENHYYAFGLKIAGISSSKLADALEGHVKNEFAYNDKELIDDADLGWYDYGFRFYDPQIGRFPQLDPLTFEYPFMTPYQYASNDPIANIDIDGLEGCKILAQVACPGVTQHMSTLAANIIAGMNMGFRIAEQALKDQMPGVNLSFSGLQSTAQAPDGDGPKDPKPGSFDDWYNKHGKEYDNRLDAFKAWQNEPGYHEGESYGDRQVRIAAASANEAKREFGSGGHHMFGGYGRSSGAVSKVFKYVRRLWQLRKVAKEIIKSVDDIAKNPRLIWKKSADEVAKILGEGWEKGAYGSDGKGWKFIKGDQSIFFHPGGGRHGGSYYGYSSGKLGKNKIVGPDYIPTQGDKATIIYIGK